jgi:hypothetical protein
LNTKLWQTPWKPEGGELLGCLFAHPSAFGFGASTTHKIGASHERSMGENPP